MPVSQVPMVCTFHAMLGMFAVDLLGGSLEESSFYGWDDDVVVFSDHCFASHLA